MLAGRTQTTAAASGRDGFVDAVRAAAILRVVVVHALGPLGWLWWPAPLWVMPGMPLVFFCSGALMWQSLDRRPDAAWQVVRGRERRLLVPVAVFVLAMVVLSAVLAAVTGAARYQLHLSGWYRWIWLDVPAPSQAVRDHDGQLWFAGTFAVLLAVAPVLARLHRRHLAMPLALAGALAVELGTTHPPQALTKLAMYAPFFCAGFYYGDGTLVRLRERRGAPPLLAAAGLLAATGAAVYVVDPRNPNIAIAAVLPVAAAWGLLLLALRPQVTALSARWDRGVRWVSDRTLSIYLAGWPAARAAERSADALFGADETGAALWTTTYLGLTALLVVVGAALLHPVEKLARRPMSDWFEWAGRGSNP